MGGPRTRLVLMSGKDRDARKGVKVCVGDGWGVRGEARMYVRLKCLRKARQLLCAFRLKRGNVRIPFDDDDSPSRRQRPDEKLGRTMTWGGYVSGDRPLGRKDTYPRRRRRVRRPSSWMMG